jgi:site-specific DNA-methyltransferase (adenine-specific)
MNSRQPLARNRVIVGDAARELEQLPTARVDMALTSPPYFRLRDYHAQGQLGLEDEVDEWVTALRGIARQIHRVLVPTGSFWLNVADTYSTHFRQGADRKSLLLGPERLALALVEDGWLLRNKIVWNKTNHVPTSVKDRLSCGWEALYVFVKQPDYFFDLDSIRVPHTSRPPKRRPGVLARTKRAAWRGPNSDDASGLVAMKAAGRVGHPLGKNPGDVWRIAASNYRGAHHATFPLALAQRAIRAGCPEARCSRCRKPWRRETLRTLTEDFGEIATRGALQPTCSCGAPSEPGLVLDPFFGAGTTGVAAEALGRDWAGIELNPEFAELAAQRIHAALPIPAAHPPPT